MCLQNNKKNIELRHWNPNGCHDHTVCHQRCIWRRIKSGALADAYECRELWNGTIEHIFRHQHKILAFVVSAYYMSIHHYYIYDSKCAFFIDQVNIKIPKALGGRRDCGYANNSTGNYLFICGGYTEEISDTNSIINQVHNTAQDDHICVSEYAQDIQITEKTNKNSKGPQSIWFKMRHNEIYVLDLKEMKIYESKILIPRIIAGPCHAICMGDKHRDELAVQGFIRTLWRNNLFKQAMLYPPDYLIKIIFKKYYNEYLHIIQRNAVTQSKGKHCKINVMEIIKSIKN